MSRDVAVLSDEECCRQLMDKVFRGEDGKFRGWLCPLCGDWRKAIGRELQHTLAAELTPVTVQRPETLQEKDDGQ
jgi:hypothetical protein